jgi:hypothetical protein
MREPRLGDVIDDFCVRCKRVMNHNVVSVINNEPAKVRCRTCHSDHDYRHEQAPPPKVDPRKHALFDEVLKKVNPGGVETPAEAEALVESDAPLESEAPLEAEAPAELAAAEETEAPKAKAKVRGKK